ncbi:MAG: anaerobic ribonucleoside-triphosphate reductase activating protein [Clostridiales bacterium]|nr:anaerobic ribonucleoside-triphosphate reductase activating protein [Clostridiales bacterium]
MDELIRIAGIVDESIVDGPGIRFVVFTQGCSHNCKGCHNPKTHSYKGGTLVRVGDIIERMKKNPLLDGLTISGGEPFDQANVVSILAHCAKKMGYNVWTYTGYLYEDLVKRAKTDLGCKTLLENIDVLVDGEFDQTKMDANLKFKGSTNQREIQIGQMYCN